MEIAVYTMTRDRFAYSVVCFDRLRETAGCAFDHYVLDNGSEDETPVWLRELLDIGQITWLELAPENLGISAGESRLLKEIAGSGVDYDVVVKMDNDCYVRSEGALQRIAEIVVGAPEFGPAWVLSPRVEGIVRQPTRLRVTQVERARVGVVSILGGLFRATPAELALRYEPDGSLSKAWGQDEDFCRWVRSVGAELGYVEGLVVEHYETTDGQAKRYPDYFARKYEEEGARSPRRIKRR